MSILQIAFAGMLVLWTCHLATGATKAGSHKLMLPRAAHVTLWDRDPSGSNELYHVFLQCTQYHGTNHVDGWVWPEESRYLDRDNKDPTNKDFPGLAANQCGTNTLALPGLQLTPAVHGPVASYNMTWLLNYCPYTQQGVRFTQIVALNTSDFWVHFAGSTRRMLVNLRCKQHYAAAAGNSATPSRWIVVPVYHHQGALIDIETHSRMLAHHMAYHMRLGFQRYLVFVMGSEAAAMWAHPVLREHLQAGRLHLVHLSIGFYTHLSSNGGQWVNPIANIAVLMFRRLQAVYIFMDLDEFFMMDQPPTQGHEGAAADSTDRAWAWQRIESCCGLIAAGNPVATVQFQRAGTGVGGPLGAEGSEQVLWVNAPPGSRSPLYEYTRRETLDGTMNDLGKTLVVNPAAVHMHMVHGVTLVEPQTVFKCPPGCVGLLHLVNMMAPRSQHVSQLPIADAPWQWALQNVTY